MDDTTIPQSRAERGRSLHDLPEEHGFVDCEIEGRLPEELSGTVYRNGPGLFSVFGHHYLNWLDGDGAISAFRFDRGRASAAARVTLTPELIDERAKKEAVYTSGSTVGPHWWRRVGGQQKNPTNIHVLAWHDRVFATTDAGMPIEIDPWTLETVGPWKLSGAAKAMVGAHSRRCPRTGSTYILGVAMGMTGMELDVYELPRAGEPRLVTAIGTHAFPFVHDFAITESHLVIAVPPLEVGVAGFLAGVSAPTKNMRWAPERGTEILLVERAAPHAVRRITTDAFFAFHFGHGFESSDGTTVAHLCVFDRFDPGEAFAIDRARSGRAWVDAAKSHLERLEIDANGTLRRTRVSDEVLEMPTVPHARETHRATWIYPLVTRDHHDRVGKLEVATGKIEIADLGAHRHPGESNFVPRREGTHEDDGWLLTQVYDASRHRSGVAVLDARRVSDGAVGTAWLSHHIPVPIHGTWVPGIPGR
ncbi:MAG: carotenoid oxygenase family protein [Deltaproteobacteria bacterium]|nr:carotenoid oxygenase family protein [Deltaproteobacteria bacterium]